MREGELFSARKKWNSMQGTGCGRSVRILYEQSISKTFLPWSSLARSSTERSKTSKMKNKRGRMDQSKITRRYKWKICTYSGPTIYVGNWGVDKLFK